MKKTVLSCLILATCLLARTGAGAQIIRYGLKAGVGAANFNYQPTAADTGDIYSTNLYYYEKGGGFRPSFSVGGVVEKPFTDKFMVSSGAQLSMAAAASSGTDRNYQFPIDFSARVFSLQIPLSAHFQLRKASIGAGGFVGFAFAGGSSLAYDTSKALYHPVYLPSTSGNHTVKFGNKTESNLRRFNAGLRAEVGYPIKMVKLSLAFEQGLVNQLPPRYYEFQEVQNRKGRLRTQSIQASIYYFWVKK